MGFINKLFGSKTPTTLSVPKPVAPAVPNPATPPSNPDYSVLLCRLQQGSYDERLNVLKELEGDKSRSAVDSLEWLMLNGSSHRGDPIRFDERALAAGALGKIGGVHARKALESVLNQAEIEADVRSALMKIAKSDASTLLDSLNTDPVTALNTLGANLDPTGVPKALSLLTSYDITKVVVSARYLGLLRISSAVAPLTALLRSEYIDILHTAGVALGRIGGEQAKRVLLETLNRAPDPVHSSHEWAISGAIKGLAFLYAAGDTSVKEPVKALSKYFTDHICSRDGWEEKELHSKVLTEMLKA